MASVLIIDDDIAVCTMLTDMVQNMGHEATHRQTLAQGLPKAISGEFDVVFLDVLMPDGSGLDVLARIRETPKPPEVIIITGAGSDTGAEIAIKNGAWDYLQKPLSPNEIYLPMNRVFQYRDGLKKQNNPAATVALNLDGIVGKSRALKRSLNSLAQAANSDANVLIYGETGTGKELFARSVHINSARANKNFVVVDCAALPETLVESTLFGYEQGAFTGADSKTEGLIKQADGGTLFLDEIGELPLANQKTFLRVLQERKFRMIGGKKEIKSDFRLVAATNRSLEQMTDEGKFRKDLLYRINSIMLEIPPLRQRHEDIEELILYYTSKICKRYKIETKGFTPDFFEAFYSYNWPGNVRELINALEGAIYEAQDEPTLFPRHLQNRIRIQLAKNSIGKKQKKHPAPQKTQESTDNHDISRPILETLSTYHDFKDTILAEREKKYFQDLIILTRGSIKEACKVSNLSRTQLYTLMKRHGVSRLGW